jgi:hypothetical protein
MDARDLAVHERLRVHDLSAERLADRLLGRRHRAEFKLKILI